MHRIQSACDYVYERLATRITSGQVAPGERLMEQRLAAEFGVSRTPVREALRQLANDRLVAKTVPRGYVVRAIDLKAMEDMYDVRSALEVLALRLAARTVGTPAFERFKSLVSDSAHAEEREPLSLEFHERLVALAGNELLIDYIRDIFTQTKAYRRLDQALAERTEIVNLDHFEIVRLLEQGSVSEAAALLEAHIARSRETLKTLQRSGLKSIAFAAATDSAVPEVSS